MLLRRCTAAWGNRQNTTTALGWVSLYSMLRHWPCTSHAPQSQKTQGYYPGGSCKPADPWCHISPADERRSWSAEPPASCMSKKSAQWGNCFHAQHMTPPPQPLQPVCYLWATSSGRWTARLNYYDTLRPQTDATCCANQCGLHLGCDGGNPRALLLTAVRLSQQTMSIRSMLQSQLIFDRDSATTETASMHVPPPWG